MGDADFKAIRARITGRVQGVWFRKWTEREANTLGLHGWVRNREDGSVEALFCGPAGQVDQMLDLCQSGPANAVVDHIETATAKGIAPKRFEVKPTV
jgi:acylphosphatase